MIVTTFAEAVLRGLSGEPKGLPPRYFYDARGSELYERITGLDDYYLTRKESEILKTRAEEILDAAGAFEHLVELGSGSARKTRFLLDEIRDREMDAVYHAVDISRAAVDACTDALRREYPELAIEGHVGEYQDVLRDLDGSAASRRFVIFLGSSIGNFNENEAAAFLGSVHDFMDDGEPFLIGTDLAKDPAVLERAYNDPEGVTAEFNLNILRRINRELGADFDLDAFEHRAWFNEDRSRIEMHLESLEDQTVRVDAVDEEFAFRKGETIHTENSYKYTLTMVREMARRSGFLVERTWTDADGWFGVHLWRRASA